MCFICPPVRVLRIDEFNCVIVIDIAIELRKKMKTLDVENEEFSTGTSFPENPSKSPNFAHLCGQRGIGT
jgi:hypothetical protein